MKKTKLLLVALLVLLCGCLLFCGCNEVSKEPEGNDDEKPSEGTGEQTEPLPYCIYYTSNGNGTCYISDITIQADSEQDITLVIPETSPDGDIVVGISIEKPFVQMSKNAPNHIPFLLTEDAFAALSATIKSNCVTELDDHYHLRFQSFYERLDLAELQSEKAKQALLEKFPLTQYAVIYQLDISASEDDLAWLSEILTQYAAYTVTDKDRDHQEIRTLAEANFEESEYYDVLYYTYSRNFSNLTSLEFPESLLSGAPDIIQQVRSHIELEFFGACEALTSLTNYSTGDKYCLEDRVLYSADQTVLAAVFNYYESAFDPETGEYIPSKFIIPDTVLEVGTYAFAWCSCLDEIVIPDGVRTIGPRAFTSCHSLTNIVIPDSVTDIGECAFSNCENLESVVLSNRLEAISGSLFFGCSSLQEIVIPDSVISIAFTPFSGCTSLQMITIPKNVAEIHPLFLHLSSVSDLAVSSENTNYRMQDDCLIHIDTQTAVITFSGEIPMGVKQIGDQAFNYCGKLNDVTIPYGVTSIGFRAFAYCDPESITIPNTIKEFSSMAFGGCENLNTIIYIGTEEEWNAITKGEDWDSGIGQYTLIFKDAVEYYVEQAQIRIRGMQSADEAARETTLYSKNLQSYIVRCEVAKKQMEETLSNPNASDSQIKVNVMNLQNTLAQMRRTFMDMVWSGQDVVDEYEFFSLALQILESQAGAAGAEAAKQEIEGYRAQAAEVIEVYKEALPFMYEKAVEILMECHSEHVDTTGMQDLVKEEYDNWLVSVD